MYAIIEDSGTQIRVAPGDVVEIDRRELPKRRKTLSFDRVLLVGDPAADVPTKIGTPYVSGATVKAKVLGEVLGRKIDVIKYKRRKGYRRKQGHRQRYLKIEITEIKSKRGKAAAAVDPDA